MSSHVTHPSMEAMLEPSVLADLLERPVGSVALRPFTTAGWSSTEAAFHAVIVDGEAAPAAVIKQIRWSSDYHAIATDDIAGREIVIWESGVLERLPPEMGHAVRGAARFEDGAALLMDDLTAHLLPEGADPTPDYALGVLRSMAAMHAAFWQDPPAGDLGPAVCPLGKLVSRISASSLQSLGVDGPDVEIVANFPEGWARLPDVVDPGAARDLRALADDPSPIVAALATFPSTLLHGDIRQPNIAWDGERAIAIDWQPSVAPPGYDVAFFVLSLWAGSPVHPEEAMATYRDMLTEELGTPVGSWWGDQLDISITAAVATLASALVLYLAEDHDPRVHPPWTSHEWWFERAKRGLRLLDAA